MSPGESPTVLDYTTLCLKEMICGSSQDSTMPDITVAMEMQNQVLIVQEGERACV